MAIHLYILSEGLDDEIFYERLAERVTGRSFGLIDEYRVRPGENWKTVMANARLLVNRFRHWTGQQVDIAFIIAVDNDRAPQHPAGRVYPCPLPAADRKKESRYPILEKMLVDSLGADRAQWPVLGALAVPVEMIESWVLILLDPALEDMPPFAQASQKTAREYYGKLPPPQLKDLRDEELKKYGVTRSELFWKAAEQSLEPAMLASPSLRLFVDQLKAW